MAYPYYTEPSHTTGTLAAAPRTTATSGSSNEDRLKVDAVDKVFLLETNKHPLVSLLTNVGRTWTGDSWTGSSIQKASTGNPEFSWHEDYYGGRYAQSSGTYTTSGGATVTLKGAGSSSAYIFTVGDLIKNKRTGEVMRVTTVASATTITVARSVGATAATAGADGDGLFLIGNTNEENATARNVNTTQSDKQSNYTQIFRRSIAVSGTQQNADMYGPRDLPYQRAKLGTEHGLDMERAFWFGEKGSTTGTNGHPQRATGGILEFIEGGNSYVQDQNGTLTAPDMNTFLREGFTYGDNNKVLFAGGVILQAINEIARGQMITKGTDKTYGIKIQEWQTSFGTVNLIHNPLFVEDYAGYGFLVDLEQFRYRYMNNRDTVLNTNIEIPGTDGTVDEYLTECGLERKQAPMSALLKGVQG